MKSSIIKLFFEKKKKILFSYTLLISNLIDMDSKYLISKNKNNHSLIKKIIDKYVDEYLYDEEEIDISFITKYIEYNINLNKTVNALMLVIINLYLDENKKDEFIKNKQALLLLSIVISCSIEFDSKTSVLKQEKIDATSIKKLIIEIVEQKCKFKLVKNTNKVIKKLTLNIKEYNNLVKNMFNNVDEVDVENYFIKYCDKDNYYIVKYKYNNEELEKYDKYYINEVLEKEKINNRLNILSYIKLSLTILKCLMLNINNYFLIEFNKKEMTTSMINKINKIFSCKQVKKRILIFIDYDDKDLEAIKLLKELNYKILIEYNNVETETNKYKFKDDEMILVKKEFVDNNTDNIEIWNNRDISFQIKTEFSVYEESSIVKENR